MRTASVAFLLGIAVQQSTALRVNLPGTEVAPRNSTAINFTPMEMMQDRAVRQYSFFIMAYKLMLGFHHTSVLLCGGTYSQISASFGMPVTTIWDSLESCKELIFDRETHGVWVQPDIGVWKPLPDEGEEQEENDVSKVTFVGTKALPYATTGEVAKAIQEWGSQCTDPISGEWLDFNPEAYGLLNHNCNYFTFQVLKKLGLSPIANMKPFAPELRRVNPVSRATLGTLVRAAWKVGVLSRLVPGITREHVNMELTYGRIVHASEDCQ